MQSTILENITYPSDLKHLDAGRLIQLASELRAKTIEIVSQTGGHLGAGLGVIELTIALHYVFDAPRDKLIWDVGHQAYPHKIITGRGDKMLTIRKENGLSGFTKRTESQYDPFGAGHSSTSISAGLGMAIARDKLVAAGKPYFEVIPIIGDGAISAGMAYEALNNTGSFKSKLIVILNDNAMSIAPAVGAMSDYLCRLKISPPFNKAREIGKKIAQNMPVPSVARDMLKKTESITRNFPNAYGNFFEELGFHYIGVLDGHNMASLVEVLGSVKESVAQRPYLIHVKTQKGKGFSLPEGSSEDYHAIKPQTIKPQTTYDATKKKGKPCQALPSYTDVFANALIKQATQDDKIIAITAAMPSGTGVGDFAKHFPERAYDVGIAEQHAITFAAGLACEGFKPYACIYSTFLQRAYDQIIHDVAIQNLPVRFIIDRAGLVGADGATHAGSFDVSMLCVLPNFAVLCPSSEEELKQMVAFSACYDASPLAIRFPRGSVAKIDADLGKGDGNIEPSNIGAGNAEAGDIREGNAGAGDIREGNAGAGDMGSGSCKIILGKIILGKGRVIYHSGYHNCDNINKNTESGKKIAILSLGTRLQDALQAGRLLAKKGGSICVADARFAKPIDKELIRQLAQENDILLTIEEGAAGGFSALVANFLLEEDLLGGKNGLIYRPLFFPDRFIEHGDVKSLHHNIGLDADGIIATILKTIEI